MNTVRVRDLVLGEGQPKICVPVIGRTKEEIELRTEELLASKPDMAEWRVDWYEASSNREQVEGMLRFLRSSLGELPLLVTFRTKQEGGEQEISAEAYEQFLGWVVESKMTDLVDVELFMGEALLTRICEKAKANGVAVVASSHDFTKTPEKAEIVQRLCRMQELGADLLKIAVMPKDAEDVLTLLSAAWEMHSRYAKQPVIAMSMGGTGAISRMAGEIFGSALTFGSAGCASAPGQIEVSELKAVLQLIHEKG